MRKQKNGALVLRIHRWIGLHIFIFLSFVFLTGSVMVFATELEVVFRSEVWVSPGKNQPGSSFGQIYDAVQAEYPHSEVTSIYKRPSPWLADRTYTHRASGGEIAVWTDPGTGQVLAATKATGFKRIWRELHDALLVPRRPVRLVLTSTSVVLMVMLVTGLLNYRRFWRGFFRFPHREMTARDWWGAAHRVIGLWAFPFLLLVALTSFAYFVEKLGFPGHAPGPRPAVERASRTPDNLNGELIDRAFAAAQNAMPDLDLRFLIFPSEKDGGFLFIGNEHDATFVIDGTRVYVDPVNLEILGAFRPQDSTGLARLMPLVEAFHYGSWAGKTSRFLWVAFGVMSGLLFLAGSLLYAARAGDGTGEVEPSASTGPARRILRGLGIFRWAYALIFIGLIVVFVLRHVL